MYIKGVQAVPSGDIVYSPATRPTSITGNYGIIGDDGKLIQVTGNTIINETNNTYYNPATGETVPITNWSYGAGGSGTGCLRPVMGTGGGRITLQKEITGIFSFATLEVYLPIFEVIPDGALDGMEGDWLGFGFVAEAAGIGNLPRDGAGGSKIGNFFGSLFGGIGKLLEAVLGKLLDASITTLLL